MASTVQSLFPELAQQLMADPVAMARANAPRSVEQSFLRDISGVGASLQENITGAFGQQTQQQRLQGIIQQAQSEADLSTPEGLLVLANKLNEYPEFSGMALAMRQQAAQLSQQGQLRSTEMARNLAQAQKATAERTGDVLTQEYTTLLTQEAQGTLVDPVQRARLSALKTYFKERAPKGVEVKPGAEQTEEEKAVGKGSGENYTKVTITDPQASETRMRAVRELQVLAGQVNTGTFAEVKAKAQALFKDIGVNIGDPTDAQTLRAAIERGVAQSQLEQKGVQTDRDANRYRQASVLLSNTPAANQYILDYQTAIDQRVKEKARSFENYRKENKSSVGAEFAWGEFIKDKDIFDSPSLTKYKETFTMRDLAVKVRNGSATQTERQELKNLMQKNKITQVKID